MEFKDEERAKAKNKVSGLRQKTTLDRKRLPDKGSEYWIQKFFMHRESKAETANGTGPQEDREIWD